MSEAIQVMRFTEALARLNQYVPPSHLVLRPGTIGWDIWCELTTYWVA